MKQHFCIGFMFSADEQRMVVIEKQKPEWMKGKLNGIGGTIEFQEHPARAMAREFKEETGVETLDTSWEHFATVIDHESSVKLELFRLIDNKSLFIPNVKTNEKEQVMVLEVQHILKGIYDVMPNLKAFIPIALNKQFRFCEINSVLGRC